MYAPSVDIEAEALDLAEGAAKLRLRHEVQARSPCDPSQTQRSRRVRPSGATAVLYSTAWES